MGNMDIESEKKGDVKRETFVGEFTSKDKLDDQASVSSNYDPFIYREIEHPNTPMGALAHLLKSSLGSGILAMPLAFKNSGLAFGMVGTIVIGYICTHCVQILVECSHKLCKKTRTPSLDFAETAEAAFASGPPSLQRFARAARIATLTALCVTYYASPTVYVVFIATNIKQVADVYMEEDFAIRIWILLVWAPILLICLIKELKYLVPFSAVANLLIVISFAITLYYVFEKLEDINDRDLIAPVGQIPLFFSTVIFAMEGIGTVMPIENTMKDPRKFIGCPGVLNTAMTVVVVLYAVIGFCGYWRYGDCTNGSITLNLDQCDILAQCVKVLIAVAIYFTYPLQFSVPTAIVWSLLEPKINKKFHFFAYYGLRVVTVTMTVLLAVAIPNLGPIISLVGAVCFSILGLFLPAMIETACRWEHGLGKYNWRMWKNCLIMLFSIFGLVAGGYASILEIIAAYGPQGESPDEPSECVIESCFNNSTRFVF